MKKSYTLPSGRLKSLREIRNYTQEYVADELGISQSYYSKIEKEQVELSVRHLCRLAEILNIEVSVLLNPLEFDPFDSLQNYHTEITKLVASIDRLERRIRELELKSRSGMYLNIVKHS